MQGGTAGTADARPRSNRRTACTCEARAGACCGGAGRAADAAQSRAGPCAALMSGAEGAGIRLRGGIQAASKRQDIGAVLNIQRAGGELVGEIA